MIVGVLVSVVASAVGCGDSMTTMRAYEVGSQKEIWVRYFHSHLGRVLLSAIDDVLNLLECFFVYQGFMLTFDYLFGVVFVCWHMDFTNIENVSEHFRKR